MKTKATSIAMMIILIVAIFIGSQPAARGMTVGSGPGHSDDAYDALNYETHTDRILSFLETRIQNQKLLEKAKHKLSTLDERQTGLIASLFDRFGDQKDRMGADIAFFLMMALIVLS